MMVRTGWMAFLMVAAVGMTGVRVSSADDSAPATAPTGAGVDDILTNNNLRALSGSKSKWSIASQYNYEGGTISSPFSQDRPDISAASGTTDKADIDGAISVKYNLDLKNSLSFGIGVRCIAPLSSRIENYSGTRFDAFNPYLQYQHIYKWFGIQSVLQVQYLKWTQADFTAYGYSHQFSVDQENMYEIGKTGLSVGVSLYAQYQLFNKSGAYSVPSDTDNYVADLATVQSVYQFIAAPELEYELNDTFNLRTLVSLLSYEHYAAGVDTLVHDTVYQSIGVGISVTRDIFLYPNIQFLPGHIEAALTNVGLSATVNLF